jgi:hypothetical protein
MAQADPPTTKVADPAQVQNQDERYRIGYQDALAIQIFRHPELNQKVNVNSNGTISLFRIDKPIVAVCKTEQELADAVEDLQRCIQIKSGAVLPVTGGTATATRAIRLLLLKGDGAAKVLPPND